MMRHVWIAAAVCGAAHAAEPLGLTVHGSNRDWPLALRIEIDGRPAEATWDAAFARLFADLDRNNDGTLDRAEAARVPAALRVRQLAWAYYFAAPAAAPWEELDVAPVDGKVTPAELCGYYRSHGVGTPLVTAGIAPSAELLTDALLKRLDRDGDGVVSQAEWDAAATTLAALDLDGDELIRPDEIVPLTPYPGSLGTALLTSIDSEKREFKPLAKFPLRPGVSANPGEVVTVRLGRRAGAVRTVERATPVDPPDAASLEFGDTRVTVYAVAGKLPDDYEAARRIALERFSESDGNGNGNVTAKEAEAGKYAAIRDHFTFADRDGDGRLTRAEWEAFLQVRSDLAAAVSFVTAYDHGRGLFEALDADGDGTLAVRELRGACKRLEALGCVADGRFDRARLPRQVRVAVSRGQPKSPLRLPLRPGPAWFLAMDRNGDGDVSRREFLGTDAEFRRLDADGDGLIGPDEAAASKAP